MNFQVPWSLHWWILAYLQLPPSAEFYKFISLILEDVKFRTSSEIRICLDALTKIQAPLNVEILTTIWDYFKERLNSNFAENKSNLMEKLAVIPTDHKTWFEQSKIDKIPSDSYQLYLKLTNAYFPKSTKPEKDLERFISRLRSKKSFNFKQLTEIGIFNVITMFVKIYVNQKSEVFANHFIQIIGNGITSERKELLPTLTKGLGAFIQALVHNEVISYIFSCLFIKKFLEIIIFFQAKQDLVQKSFNILNTKCLEESIRLKNQDSKQNSALTFNIIKSYLSLVQDTIHSEIVLGVDKLVNPVLIHYLKEYASHSETKVSEAHFILECFVSKKKVF